MADANWEVLKQAAYASLAELPQDPVYKARLDFEISEVEKQGTNQYWVDQVRAQSQFASNPSNLLLPYLLGMVAENPIAGRESMVPTSSHFNYVMDYIKQHGLPVDLYRDQDSPDIDLDCLRNVRDQIKAYAIEKYSTDKNDPYGSVCSVGTFQTYLFKSALIDAAEGLGVCGKFEVEAITTQLPEDVDNLKDNGESKCKGRVTNDAGEEVDCGTRHNQVLCPKCGSADTDDPTIGALLNDHDLLRQFAERYPVVVGYAVRLVGKIQHMGKHAGALIIADRPLFGNIPMFKKSGEGHWISMWTEGRNTQLSKLGYNKWDVLGLKCLDMIYEVAQMVERNHGVAFGKNLELLDEVDPEQGWGGAYIKDGVKHHIDLNDPKALQIANELRTNGVFQFDTDLARSILTNGVRSFNDLVLMNALGHPGPMACVRVGSMVDTGKGPMPIQDVRQQNDAIQYLDQFGDVSFTRNYIAAPQGEKPLLRIRFDDGTTEEVGLDHRFMTTTGYKRAEEVVVGEEVVGIADCTNGYLDSLTVPLDQ